MIWEHVKERLEAVLQSPIQISLIPESEWHQLVEDQERITEDSVEVLTGVRKCYFIVSQEHKEIRVLLMDGS